MKTLDKNNIQTSLLFILFILLIFSINISSSDISNNTSLDSNLNEEKAIDSITSSEEFQEFIEMLKYIDTSYVRKL